MQSNKPITKTITTGASSYDINGNPVATTSVEKTFDRLAVDLTITGRPTNGNGAIITGGSIKFKKCTADGYITSKDEVRYSFPDISKCNDVDVLTAFSQIEAILTELVNKKDI
jgi:hypothetical protein